MSVKTVSAGFSPSQIDPFRKRIEKYDQVSAMPFIATFGHAESEVFAAMLVFTLAASGDEWVAIEPRAVGLWLQKVIAEPEEKTKWEILSLARPHPHTLVKEGFCRFSDEDTSHSAIEFTELGIERLAPWVRP